MNSHLFCNLPTLCKFYYVPPQRSKERVRSLIDARVLPRHFCYECAVLYLNLIQMESKWTELTHECDPGF